MPRSDARELMTSPADSQPAIEAEASSLAEALTAEVARLTVRDHMTYDGAAALRQQIRDAIARIKAQVDPLCEAAHKAWKATTEFRSRLVAPLEAADKTVRTKQEEWLAEERKRQLEEARRLEAERRRQLEEARRQAEDEALRRAAELERVGDKAAAAAVLEEPITVTAPAAEEVIAAAPKYTRERWRAEVTSKLAVVRYIAAHPELLDAVELVQSVLDGWAARDRDALAVPGLSAVCDVIAVARSTRQGR